MSDALSIALSGLNAQSQRLSATASNIANVSSSGVVPPKEGTSVYTPVTVNLTSQGSGGVVADVVPKQNPYSVSYDPSSQNANAEGYIAVPNVDLTEEIVGLTEIKAAFKANLAVIKTEDEMMGALLDTLA